MISDGTITTEIDNNIIGTTSAHNLHFKQGGTIITYITTSGLLPYSDNTYDLGSSSHRWKDGYFAGNVEAGNVEIGGNLGVSIIEDFYSWGNEPAIPRLNNVLALADQRFTVTVSATPTTGIVSSMFSHNFTSAARWDTTVTYPVTIEIDLGSTYHYFKKLGIYFIFGRYPGYVKMEVYNTSTSTWDTLKEISDNTDDHVFWIGEKSYVGKIKITIDQPTANPYNEIAIALIYAESSDLIRSKGGGHPHLPNLMVNGYEVLTYDRKLKNIQSIEQNIIPGADSTYDLGSSSYKWRVGYFSDSVRTYLGTSSNGNIHYHLYTGTTRRWGIGLGGEESGGNTGSDFKIWRYADDGSYLGESLLITRSSGAIYLKDTTYVTGNLNPGADDAYYLGGTSYRWRQVFVSSAVNVGTLATGAYRGAILSGSEGSIELWRGDDGTPYIDFKTDYATDYDARIVKTSGHGLEFRVGGSGSIITALTLDSDGTTITRNIRPFADNTYDLGSSSYKWSVGYFSRLVVGHSLDDNGTRIEYSPGTPTATRTLFGVGDTTQSPGYVIYWVRDTTPQDYLKLGASWCPVYFRGQVYPNTDNAYDLGSSSLRWRDGYFAGTVDMGRLEIDGILTIDDYRRLRRLVFGVDMLSDFNYFELCDLGMFADARYTVTVTPSPISGTISSMFQNDARYAYAKFDSSPVTVEIDMGTNVHYWRGCIIYATKNAGDALDEIKVEYYDTTTSTWNTYTSITNDTTIIYFPNTSQNYVSKWRITFTATLAAGEDIRVRRISLYNFYILNNNRYRSYPFISVAGDYVFGSLIPYPDNTVDLGNSSYRWKTIYLASTGALIELYGTSSSATNPCIEFKEDGASSYWQLGKRGSAFSGQPDYFFLSYYNGSSWNPHMYFTGTQILAAKTVRPSSDNSLDLGSASYRWNTAYFANDIRISDGAGLRSTAGARIATGGGGQTFQTWAGGSSADAFAANIYDGTQVFRIISDGTVITRSVRPMTDNAYDLGSSSYRWKNLHLSSANSLLELLARHKGPFWFNSHWLPSGMMTYATTGSGTVSWYDNYVGLDTGTTSGSTVKTYKRFYGFNNTYSWDKKRVFGAEVYFSSYTNQVVWIVSGWITDITASSATDRHIGFKLVNGTLYGTVADGTTEATLTLKTLSSDAHMTLEYVYTPGSEVRFYVDGVDKGAITTNLPSGTINALYALFASVYNSAAEQKRLNIYDIRVIQDE